MLDASGFKFVYTNEHGRDRTVIRPTAVSVRDLRERLEELEVAHGVAQAAMAEIAHENWLVLWTDQPAALATAEGLLGLAPPVAIVRGLFAWYYIGKTELALVLSQPQQRKRLRESLLLPPSVSLSEHADRWAVIA